MRKIIEAFRDLVLWGVPIVALLVAVFGFNLPLWFAVPLAIVLLAALYFILPQRTTSQETQDDMRQEVEQLLRDTREQINRIRALASQVKKQSVREQILKIAAMADGIVGDLLSKPGATLLTATRLKYTFAQTYDILNFYSEMTNGKVTTTDDKRALLTAQIENNVLDQLQTSLREFAIQKDQSQVVSLEAAIKTLENTLKLEGIG